MPGKKKKYNSRFPPARIKKIMQSDEEVGKVAAPVPVIISRALELFVHSLLTQAGKVTAARHAKTLTPSHLKQCIMSEQRFDFLQELFVSIPDIVTETDDSEPLTPISTSALQFPTQDAEYSSTTSAKPRGRGRGRGRKSVDNPNVIKSYKYKRHRKVRNQTASTTSMDEDTLEDDDDEDSDEVLKLDLASSSGEDSESDKPSRSFRKLSTSNNSKDPPSPIEDGNYIPSKRLSSSSSTSGPSPPIIPLGPMASATLPGGIEISIPGLGISIPSSGSEKVATSPSISRNGSSGAFSLAGESRTCVPVPVITSVKQQRSLSQTTSSSVEVDEDYDC